MFTARAERLYYLTIQGPLSLESMAADEAAADERLLAFVLIGPTGSGKSSFVESVAPDQGLSISKNTLQSVTQNVVCYRVKNLWHKDDYNFVMIDTPGFLDPELSESRIIRMITDTLDSLRKSAMVVIVDVLYFQPITDIRIGRSKQDSVNLFRSFAESFKASNIDVVTTMWNTLATSEQIEDANRRLECLREEIFNSTEAPHTKVSKWDPATHSALSIMDRIWSGWRHDVKAIEHYDPRCQSLVRDNLIKRVAEALEHLQLIAEDMQHATTPGQEDSVLLAVVHENGRLTLETLQSFLDELYEIDPTSCSSPFPREAGPAPSVIPPLLTRRTSRHLKASFMRIKNALTIRKR